jgi:hypothetical protein
MLLPVSAELNPAQVLTSTAKAHLPANNNTNAIVKHTINLFIFNLLAY